MPREDRERRFIADYLHYAYPGGGYYTNVPLGEIPPDILAKHGLQAGAALFRPARLRIDAVYPTPTAYWLIEAKIREPKSAIGDLLVYREVARKTTDLPEYTGQELRCRLVVPWAVDWIRALATAHGFDCVEYTPAWIEDYVRSRQDYFTNSYRTARDEKMRLRKTFGLE